MDLVYYFSILHSIVIPSFPSDGAGSSPLPSSCTLLLVKFIQPIKRGFYRQHTYEIIFNCFLGFTHIKYLAWLYSCVVTVTINI